MSGDPAPISDAESFCLLYSRTHLIVYRYIYGLHGGPAQEVEDLTAETFTRAWKARAQFRGDHNGALGWLLIIARNLVIDSIRRAHTNPAIQVFEEQDIDFEVKDEGEGPEEALLRKERLKVLASMLQSLTTEQREMLVLRYMLGWPVYQIASQLGLPENTVSVYLRRALQRIKQNWPKNWNQESIR